ncbi:MAG: prepilin-type N-terminal cleavage/methylation domain-containing protein [Myxococcota bacterium]|jgi:prepilin-type N-terminal cleavage/methylation domain-containing protein|nr:prepilin-type N-terminal cleavage/methylation domain-containing protein [Myxococcota bacterium]
MKKTATFTSALSLHRLRPRASARSGFTIIEVLIAVLVMVIGLVGVMAMQVVAIQANGQSRDVSEATAIAEHFATILQQDGSNWQQSGNLGNTIYLQDAIASAGAWFSPYSAPVNALGLALPNLDAGDKAIGRAKFCVEFNARWGLANELVSGYVMVYWPRVGGQSMGACTDAANINGNTNNARSQFWVTTIPYAIRRSI